MTIYRELRCAACSKLLAVGSGSVQIKCQRCKTVNQFSSLTTRSWERFAGSQTLTVSSTINRNSSYDDHLIYKF